MDWHSLIAEFTAQAVVVADPVLDAVNNVVLVRFAHDDLADACVDYELFAHHAGAGAGYDAVRCRIDARHIERGVKHLVSVCRNDGVCFRVNGTAPLIALAARDAELVSHAVLEIGAVFSASGRTVVARRNDDVVFDDDRTVLLAQTGASLGDRLRDVEIIIDFVWSDHSVIPFPFVISFISITNKWKEIKRFL